MSHQWEKRSDKNDDNDEEEEDMVDVMIKKVLSKVLKKGSSRYKVLSKLQDLCDEKDRIEADYTLTSNEKLEKISKLTLNYDDVKCSVSDLGLTFQFAPSSSIYGYSSYALVEDGDDVDVTIDNARQYMDLTLDFCFHSGIHKQMEAFKAGIGI
ncbi:E3 ubiquitin-protein ligase HECTD1-like [Clavelina lepadiformis]|uniref:E3 ubiquitin-protein ligase HECTD1-like n=1 Tax=Clavelina lepadiformis TaxID=159417 RepID=UPI0040415DE9